MATQMIDKRYALNCNLYYKLRFIVQHLLADGGLMLIPQHANTALCRNLVHPA